MSTPEQKAREEIDRQLAQAGHPDQKRHLREGFVAGADIVAATARLGLMNLYLHDINADPPPIRSGVDSLAQDTGDRYSMVLTNPPFGRRSSISYVNDEGELEKEDHACERQDFWTTTIVVPDNVLFEGGAGETVRRNLLHQIEVHTPFRLPTGIFYAQGVKANVLFFDRRPGRADPWTERLWVYDPRTNQHFTQKENPLHREHLDEFVECCRPGSRQERAPTWTEAAPEGRWRSNAYGDLAKRDKLNLDIFWLKDKSLEESEDLPEPEVLAQEIIEELQAALEQFSAVAAKLVKD